MNLCRRHRLFTKVKHMFWVWRGCDYFLGSNTAVFQWHEKPSWYYYISIIPQQSYWFNVQGSPPYPCVCESIVPEPKQQVAVGVCSVSFNIVYKCAVHNGDIRAWKNELRKKDDVKNILLSWAIIRFFKSRTGQCLSCIGINQRCSGYTHAWRAPYQARIQFLHS